MGTTAGRVVRHLLSFAGPVAVVVGAGLVLARPAEWTPSLRVQAQDAEVLARRPDVVVLGSSYAVTDTDPQALAAALGDPAPTVSVLGVPGSPSAVWYAVLRERVYGNGASPRLVVLVASMGTLMQGRVPEGTARLLVEQGGELDAPSARKAGLPSPDDTIATVRAQRARLRDAWVAAFRAVPTSLVFGVGHDVAEAAADEVFAAQASAGAGAPARSLPVVEAPDDDPEVSFAAALDDPAASFLPEIVALARSRGAEVAVAFPPTQSGKGAGQWASPAGEAAALRWAHDHGVGWVDLRDRTPPPSHFRDRRHMTPRGAATFSAELGAALRDLGGLAAPLRPPDLAPAAERVSPGGPPTFPPAAASTDGCAYSARFPELPPLDDAALFLGGLGAASPLQVTVAGVALDRAARRSELNEGCTGTWSFTAPRLAVSLPAADAPRPVLALTPEFPIRRAGLPPTWWLYPGGGGRWSWAEPPTAGATEVEVELRTLGAGEGGYRLRVGDQTVVLTSAADGAWSARLRTEVAPSGVTVEADADAPYALVTALRLQAGSRAVSVVAPAGPRAVSLLGATTPWPDPPPATGELAADSADRGWFRVPHDDRAACLPYEVTEDGVARPGQIQTRPVAYRPAVTRTQLVGDRVWFRSSDGRPIAGNESRYALRYRADRACGSAHWLYPGDTIPIEVGARELGALLGPPRALVLHGTPTQDDGGAVSVRVESGGVEVARGAAPLAQLAAGWSLALPAPASLAAARAPLRVTLSLPAGGAAVVTEAQLLDAPPASASQTVTLEPALVEDRQPD